MKPVPSSKPVEGTGQPANDNHSQPSGSSALLDMISRNNDEEAIADLVKRTERMGLLVVVAMGGCLILAPTIYFALAYGI